MVREIVKDTNILSQVSAAAGKEDAPLFRDLADTLAACSDRCVGMAANMIGIHKTVLAAIIGNEIMIMINPVIIDKSKAVYEAAEGCLSLSGVRTVTRHRVITVEYLDRKFKRKRQTFKDRDAQIIQHEMDHFSGRLI